MLGWLDIATLEETKGFNGSFVARSAAGLPFLLHEGMDVALVPPVLDMPRNVEVESVSDPQGACAKVRFSGISSSDAAEKLIGCHCLVKESSLGDITCSPELPLDDAIAGEYGIADASELIGWELQDEIGQHLATVADVEDNPAHPFLIVVSSEGEEAMIPLVADFLIEADEDSHILVVRLPKGLMSI